MENKNSDDPSQPMRRLFYTLVLAEVVFKVGDEVQILKHQFFENSDMSHLRAHRIARMQQAAAFQLKQTMPPDVQEKFQVLDTFLLAIIPLGEMSQDEFWEGMGNDLDTPAAAPAPVEPTGATVLPFTPKQPE